ncbi:MAG: SAF domain-containing protein [Jatrophihabitantaceae bacterium]
MSLSSPTPKRIKTPSWLDLRLVTGVVLVLASVLIGAKVVSGAHHTYRMLSVTRDLAAGSTLKPSDVTSVEAQLPGHGAGIYLSDAAHAVGRQLNRPLAEGELVPVAALRDEPTSTTLSVPFEAGNAPALRAGQRIELWVSTKTCPSVVLLADVTVQDVRTSERQIGSSGGQDVVLGVSAALADRVVTALAHDGAVIRAGLLSGARHDGGNDALPSLDDCLAPSS